ncbi:MAG: hypothetical protein IPM92_03025 [Saprospiraceae bacterium]|nr:hypothetical protein [Saprospiraceae bacterium]
MPLKTSPGFKAIFPKSDDTIDDLIKNIPTAALLTNLAVISTQIHFSHNEVDILHLFLRRIPHDELISIKQRISKFEKEQETGITLFSEFYITEFMVYALQFSNDRLEDTTPEEDLKIFKAYLLIVNKTLKELDDVMQGVKVNSDHSFNSLSWPYMTKQFQFNQRPQEIFQSIRTLVLLDELKKDYDAKLLLNKFEEEIHMTCEDYVYNLMNIARLNKTREMDGFDVNLFFVSVKENMHHFLNHLRLNVLEIIKEKNYNKDYLAIKKYPLLGYKEYNFIVLNWNFLKNKIYNGFIFDIYYRAQLNKVYSGFENFKSFIGKRISEERIFMPIMSAIYSMKHKVFQFGKEDGQPDAYLRERNKIFLFEFKDNLMPSSIVESYDFDQINHEVDKKFVQNDRGKPKGVMQLINQIHYLNETSYKFDDFEIKKLKRNRIEIYPIIIYTDFSYSLPGINNYLTGIFKSNLKINKFKAIHDPVMLNLNFLFELLPHLQTTRLDLLIESYIKFVREAKAQVEKSLNPNDWFKANLSFEFAVPFKKIKKNTNIKEFISLPEILGLK